MTLPIIFNDTTMEPRILTVDDAKKYIEEYFANRADDDVHQELIKDLYGKEVNSNINLIFFLNII